MKLYLLLSVFAVVLLLVGLRFVDPAPPRHVVMATAAPGGAYQLFGEKYRAFLAKNGITLELKETSGSVENLRLLAEKKVDVAFVQTGVGNAEEHPEFESIASVGFEPLWLFYRGAKVQRLSELRGKKIAVGAPESGTQALAVRLLGDNGLSDPAHEQAIGGKVAADALRQGTVEAAFFVSSPQSGLIRELLEDNGLQVMSLDRIAAYAARYPFLSTLFMPEGVLSLASNIPREDVRLVSPVITLVARKDFHPAVGTLLLQAGREIHGKQSVFEAPNQFPSVNFTDFPVKKEARHFLEHGPSFLSRHLPFRVASMIERLSFLLLPLITLLIPLFRMAPPIYVWRTRRQIYRWYEKLQDLETKLRNLPREVPAILEAESKGIHDEIERLDGEVARVKVPLSYMDELYRLRTHIQLVLKEKAKSAAEAS